MATVKELTENFDIESYLSSRNIDYKTEGSDISQNWIGISCMFNFCHGYHLGINRDHKGFKCWICGIKGTLWDFLVKVDDIPETDKGRVFRVLEEFQLFYPEQESKVKKLKKKEKTILPIGFRFIKENKEPKFVKKWFKRRKFSLSLCQKFNIGWAPIGSDYPLHIIAPVYINRKIVSFVAINPIKDGTYLICPNKKALISKGEIVYGLDQHQGNKVFFVEGLTDKWRIGDSAVALLTHNWTLAQILLVYKMLGKKIEPIILLDADSHKIAEEMSIHVDKLYGYGKIVMLDKGDPDKMSKKELKKILDL